MSVNSVSVPSGSSRPFNLIPGERVLTSGNTADLELRVPPTPEGPKRTEAASGRLWVTDRRVVFLAGSGDAGSLSSRPSAAYDAPPSLTSMQIPYSCLLQSTFQLPIFGANHLLLSFLPDLTVLPGPSALPDPGRGGKIELKVVVGEGAGHGVWKIVEGERGRSSERRQEEDTLPVYTAQAQDGSTTIRPT